MTYVKISEKANEIATLFSSPKRQFIFDNGLLIFELSKMESLLNPEFETPKSFFLKRITFKIPNQLLNFESFLKKFLDFQNTTKVPGLLRLHHVYKHEDSLYLIQRNYKLVLHAKKEQTELETLIVAKEIAKFYFQMKQDDMFQEFVENPFPLRKLDPELIFYYRKVPKNTSKSSLERYKLRVDLLMFDNKENSEGKLNGATFHLKEFERIIRDLYKPLVRISVCGRSLLRIMGPECHWKEIFAHPLFKVDYEVTPNLSFWRITEEDRRRETFFERKREEVKDELEKTVDFKEKPDRRIGKLNLETNKFENLDGNYNHGKSEIKGEENLNLEDGFDKGITKSKIASITQPIGKKNQISPENINHHNYNDGTRIEDQNENLVLPPNSPPVKITKDVPQFEKKGCGDCRLI